MRSIANSAVTKQNSYKLKKQKFLGASFDAESRNMVHSVITAESHNLHFISEPLVPRNDFLSIQSDSFHLKAEVDNCYMEISVSGFVKVSHPSEEDELIIEIIQVRQQENGGTDSRTICETLLIPRVDCFNLNCIVLSKSTDVFRIQYCYLTSITATSVLMNINNVIIKIKLLEVS